MMLGLVLGQQLVGSILSSVASGKGKHVCCACALLPVVVVFVDKMCVCLRCEMCVVLRGLHDRSSVDMFNNPSWNGVGEPRPRSRVASAHTNTYTSSCALLYVCSTVRVRVNPRVASCFLKCS